MDHPVATTDGAPPTIVAPAFAPGALIADRYRLEARLGAGGGGTVWRCVDEKLAMTVALKIVGSSGGELERWRGEVAMARRIADRNVCRVHDLGEAEGVRFVTMELIDGVGLRAKIASGLPREQARDLFVQVVGGVAAIHAAGVVHRDLKPENVVVASDGRAVIVDFGVAMPANVAHSAIAGTPRYMSPEQAAGQAVDARSDIWALGLLGYEMLTGSLPEGGKIEAVPAWPAIAPVLRKCLAVAPADRYPDAQAMRHAIARSRWRAWAKPIALVALAAALCAALVVGVLLSRGPEQLPAVRIAKLTIAAPFSVSLSPDAKELAYTTSDGHLFVTSSGTPHEWPLPALVTSWTVGWFGDRSLAIVGMSADGTWKLVRVYPDGRSAVLYSSTERFTATAAGERAVIGVHENSVYAIDPARPDEIEPIATLGTGEIVMALALSPDAKRVAVARLPPGNEDARIQVMTMNGETKQIWHGHVDNDVDQVLAWLDDHRIAFVQRDKTATLFVHDLRTSVTRQRYTWAPGAYVGIGSAARGQLVILGGSLQRSVAIGGPDAEALRPVTAGGALPAGWTLDGHLVFSLTDARGSRVVRATAGGAVEDWKGLGAGEVPDTVLGNDVIVHRIDRGQTVIERVDRAGVRKELQRLPAVEARYLVRCAGDRQRPCLIEQSAGGYVTWNRFDADLGQISKSWHRRLRRERYMQTAALSLDGKTLAIVEGTSELVLVDVHGGNTRTIDAGNGVELQTVAFAPDGSLYATAMGYRGQFFALLSFPLRDGQLAGEPTPLQSGATRFFWRPSPSPDGKSLAVQVLDFDLAISRLTGV